jgi:hypothetical protein
MFKGTIKTLGFFSIFCALVLTFPRPSRAQSTDDAVLQPAEPDYRVINLPTTLRLPLYKSSFELTHRFNGNLRNDFSDQAASLFGIDEGATVGFEYRFAPIRHVQLVAFRTSFDRTIQLYTKWDALHQNGSMWVSISPLLSIEGGDNFSERYAPSVGASISRQIDDVVALYAVPMFSHNVAAILNEFLGVRRDTFYLGLGARVRIRPTVYLSAEVSPRIAGYAPGQAEYGFAIEKRVGAHFFQLNFTNSSLTTFAQTAAGGQEGDLQMGFNLTRKFF